MDDVMTVADHLGWDQFHFWGHSMGGGVAFHTIIEHGERLQKVILIAPMSPYGFGGTKDAQGTPTYPDYAGSGGGLASPDRLKMMQEGYRGADNPQAPLFLLRSVVFKPPYQIPREDALLSAFLATAVGENNLPGNSVPSANWPFVAPGDKGIQNAFSPKYYNTGNLITATHKPPILWAYGSHDAIVSNNSLSDIATLGKMGIVPGYPGEAVMPSQPMIDQIRAVLDGYKANGGDYTEHVFETVGHSPQFERFEEFLALAKAFTG
jgi:pimeloyl-ACP methyl ester carboxylesterase